MIKLIIHNYLIILTLMKLQYAKLAILIIMWDRQINVLKLVLIARLDFALNKDQIQFVQNAIIRI